MTNKMQVRTQVIRILATYLRSQHKDCSIKEAVEISTFQHDLVYQAMDVVLSRPAKQVEKVAEAPPQKMGKNPTDFSKPIVDASDALQVDLAGGPESVRR